MSRNFQPYEKYTISAAVVSLILFVSIHAVYEFGSGDLLYTALLMLGFFTSSFGIAAYVCGRLLEARYREDIKRRNG